MKTADIENITDTMPFVSNSDRFIFAIHCDDVCVGAKSFRVFDFIPDSLNSVEFADCMERCVRMLQKDLESKTRVYMWYCSPRPFKTEGFQSKEYYEQMGKILEDICEKKHTDLAMPEKVVERYVSFKDAEAEQKGEAWKPTFRFSFMVGEDFVEDSKGNRTYRKYNTIYERIWDGSVYCPMVTKFVDFTNYGNLPSTVGEYTRFLVGRMLLAGNPEDACEKNDNRKNVLREIQKDIISTICGDKEEREYTKAMVGYGRRYGFMSPRAQRKQAESYALWMKDKTEAYKEEIALFK